ncbi:S1 family peptidase [Streptacidiphilus carbonis]|uniref:S1 family peptidase n=1 Tax=Streptacidiphilus carbonis TaxID=105422 RepID=UPI0005A78BC3|nr:serine protease [Streptacidiphilus carbonis]
MDVQRVVEVWNPAGKIAGTGYLITDRLVLTAHHNVRDADSASARALEVRRLAVYGEPPATWVAASVLWPEQPPDVEQDPQADAALLLITDAAWQPPASAAPVRWGRLPSPGAVESRVSCRAVGFPEAEQRDGQRDTKQISGHIETLTGLKSGLITAHIDEVATPSTPGASSPWSGASGAALFCGNLLTGVVTTDRARNYPGTQLVAVPLATLADRPGFASKVAGNSLSLEDVAASASGDRHPAGRYDVDKPVGLHNQRNALRRFKDTEFLGSIESSSALQRALSVLAEGTFLGNKVPTDVLTSLDEFVTVREADPRGFHDTDVERAYRVFLAAARDLLTRTDEGMLPMKVREGWSEIPGEWYDEDRKRWDKAEKEILETWGGFLDAHDAFALAGHGALLN